MQAKKVIELKIGALMFLVVLIFGTIIARLAYLQLWQTEQYNLKAQSNRIRLITITAPRGEIKDKYGQVLVKSRPSYVVSLALLDLKEADQEAVFERLAGILNIPVKEIEEKVKGQRLKYEPVRIVTDVPYDTIVKIEESRMDLPGVLIEVEPMRNYVYGDFASHILGYTRQVGEDVFQAMVEQFPAEQFKPNDRFGRAGLEKTMEEDLHGLDGALQVEVDSRIRPVRQLGLKEPIPGNDLLLTIDAKVQRAAEESLDRTMKAVQAEFPNAQAGAVVLTDVRTGEVIAMASKPSFDPARFNQPIPVAEWNTQFSDNLPFPPLVNRALRPYAPGSTFKMITAMAALESKIWDDKRVVYDPGYYRLGPRAFKCWLTSGHGRVDLRRALQVSCNTYFFTAAITVGSEAVTKMAKEFGFGEKTGIELPAEAEGTVPTAEWKKATNQKLVDWKFDKIFKELDEKYQALLNKAETDKEREKLNKKWQQERKQQEAQYKIELNWNTKWQSFDTLNTSIGQGSNYYTPLQLAMYTATIANGGFRYKPFIVKKIVDPTGKVVKETQPEVIDKVNVSEKSLQAVREGMAKVTDPGGTAYGRFATFPVKVAAKTGTAQVAGKDNHGLFVGFAPVDNPEVAIAAVVEHGGHGGTSAGVVAKDVLAAYFNNGQLPAQDQGQTSASAEE